MAALTDEPTSTPGNNAPIRAFLAIRVPYAAAMLEGLRSDPDLLTLPVRWQMPEGLHITLAFLGEAPSRQLAALWPEVARRAQQHVRLKLGLLQPELFPDARRPSVVAAPVNDGRGLLQAVQAEAVQALRDGGFDLEERTFRPHVSLGRLRPPLLRGQAAAIAAALRQRQWPDAGTFSVESVCLMRSDLFPDGARYSLLAEAPLSESGRR
jgi:2'-5' RNA ligase